MEKITPLAVRKDNYIWLYQRNNDVIIFDPCESQIVIDFISHHQLIPQAICITHHHEDHVAGVSALHQQFPEIAIYGSKEVAELVTHQVAGGDTFLLLNQPVQIIHSAGHTTDHVSYLINYHLFCGDALFSAGCGRVFTGDYQSQFNTLQTFNSLADEVIIYPAHEYTATNLRFALEVMGSQATLLAYQAKVNKLRSANQPSLPSTIGLEKQINPFLNASSLAEFIALRQQRDNFR